MITLKVTITGEQETLRYIQKINKTLPKAGEKIIKKYADFVKRSAKVRARVRRWAATGETSRSIKVSPEGKNKISVSMESRAAPFQELGYAPHYVSIANLSKRAKQSLEIWKRGNPSKTTTGKKGMIFVRTFEPILSPAIEKANEKLDEWIDEEVSSALRK